MNVQVNGISMHIEVVVADGCNLQDRTPLLLLHGFTGSTTTWHPFCERWSQSQPLILVDIIGHGESEKPKDSSRYSMEHAVNDLRSILDHLVLDKVHILGYSMGGRVALSFAVCHPERVDYLILESSSPGLLTEKERIMRRQSDSLLADRIEQIGIPAFIEEWENIPLFATQKILPQKIQLAIRTQRLQNDSVGLANSLRGMGTGAQPSWWDALQTIGNPTLLIAGELDQKFTNISKEIKKCLRHADLTIVPDVGHAIHVEQSQIFGTIVEDFLIRRQ